MLALESIRIFSSNTKNLKSALRTVHMKFIYAVYNYYSEVHLTKG
jgi:hypothetical protein